MWHIMRGQARLITHYWAHSQFDLRNVISEEDEMRKLAVCLVLVSALMMMFSTDSWSQGRIKAIKVAPGEAVHVNQVLVEFEKE